MTNLVSSPCYSSLPRDMREREKEREMEENSKTDLQASDFPIANTVGSQNVGSSDSLSLLSEPPDIRNWFSSYVYESPVLDTSEDFRGFGDEERKCEKKGFNTEESNRESENLGEFRTTRRIASNDSVKCNSFVGNRRQEDQSANKNMDSSAMLSLLSEPPDIRNWFSSYVYESPVLNSDDFRLFGNKESECEKEGFKIEESNKENLGDFKTTRKIASNDFTRNMEQEDQSVTKGNQWVDGNKNSPILNNLPFEKISDRNVEEKMTQNHYSSPAKDVKRSSLLDENSFGKPYRKFSGEPGLMPLNINKSSCKNDRKSSERLLHRGISIAESLEVEAQTEKVDIVIAERDLDLIPINGDSMNNSTCKSNEKENRGKDFTENGFVSTRKKKSNRANDENSLQRPQQVKFECLRNVGTVSLAGEKDAFVKRKALSETTNFQNCDVLEIAGKWKCPQKSKPNLGPPLKQLRLEQWVRRV